MQIGTFHLPGRLFLAPMAGITDKPFRRLCRRLGAAYAVSEMVTSRPDLQGSAKTSLRLDHAGEDAPVAVQISGADATMMANAARANIELGAQIIDINMGCPARKVCSKWAGSALMQNEPLALQIVQAVVAACAPHRVPVTLKMRTGQDAARRNAVALARRLADAGVQMLVVHGRTREQGYRGSAEYDTIAAVKAAVPIAVVANGDVDSPQKAQAVLRATGADALMIGRAAQGRPWLFREVAHYLASGQILAAPLTEEVRHIVLEHLRGHYAMYGEVTGVRTARRRIGWYVQGLPGGEGLRRYVNQAQESAAQLRAVDRYFEKLARQAERLPQTAAAAQAITAAGVEAI